MRKSPIRHHVNHHRRKGRPVRDYERGHGSHPAKPTLRHNVQSSGSFMVNISYTSQAPETFPINASDHAQAIELAMISRKSLTPPIQIDVTKP